MGLAATLYQQTEKKPFNSNHFWMKLNGKPKWQQLVDDLKNDNKRLKKNDGSSSQQSIGLDDEEKEVVGEDGRATAPMKNHQVMENNWEKGRPARDAAVTKMSATWTFIFSMRGKKKEERYTLMLDAQKEMMDWDRERVNNKLQIKREKIELEKQEACVKWELEKAQTFGTIELEKERLQLAQDIEDSRIILADANLLDSEGKKWLETRKKEINLRREYEGTRAVAAAADAAQMAPCE